jgi:hypothetical protein
MSQASAAVELNSSVFWVVTRRKGKNTHTAERSGQQLVI